MEGNQPDRLKLGSANWLCSVRSLAQTLRRPDEVARKMLIDLRVPLIKLPEGDTEYFNLFALDLVLFAATDWAGPGWDGKDPSEILKVGLGAPAFRERMAGVATLYQSEHYRNIRQNLSSVGRAILKKIDPQPDPKAAFAGLSTTPGGRLAKAYQRIADEEEEARIQAGEKPQSRRPSRPSSGPGSRGPQLTKARRDGKGLGRKSMGPRKRRSRYNPNEWHWWKGPHEWRLRPLPGPVSKGRIIGGPPETAPEESLPPTQTPEPSEEAIAEVTGEETASECS